MLIFTGLWALVDWNDLFANRFAHVFAQGAVQTIVFELLQNVRAPAGTTGDCEYRREKIGRDAE